MARRLTENGAQMMTVPTTAQAEPGADVLAIDCQELYYSFQEGLESALNGATLQLPRGARCLLVGANGGEWSRTRCHGG
jgi:CCR4-NOT complex subunit CAF16